MIDEKLYDPSYGKKFEGANIDASLLRLDNEAMDAFSKPVMEIGDTLLWFIRKNPASLDLKYIHDDYDGEP